MAADNFPATRMKLKKLLALKEFQELQQRARADEKNIRQYIKEARQKFDLSPYWIELLRFILLYGYSPDNLAGGAVIVTAKDLDIDTEFYQIAVYPETSKRDVERAYAVINDRYAERGDKRRSRTSRRFDIEVRAATFKDQGLSSQQIAEQLDTEEITITADMVPDLIAKGQKKISRFKTAI
jgi:hypothetical protein